MRVIPLRTLPGLRPPWALPYAAPRAPGATRPWLQERAFTTFRWWAILLGVLSSLAAPRHVFASLALLIALAGGNAAVAGLLAAGPDPRRLARARQLATALEWSGAAAFMLLRADEAHAATADVLVLLVAIVGARYRLRGLALGTLAAWFAIALLVAMQTRVHGILSADEAWQVAAERANLIWLTALAIATLVTVSDDERRALAWRHGDDVRALEERHAAERLAMDARHAAELDAFRRERSGLSAREWELLPLLARGLTYAQAAQQMGVEIESIRTYVRRIGAKLDAHGRQAIVAAARQRGWLADDAPRAPQPDA